MRPDHQQRGSEGRARNGAKAERTEVREPVAERTAPGLDFSPSASGHGNELGWLPAMEALHHQVKDNHIRRGEIVIVRYEDFVDQEAERVCRCLLTFALSPSGLREGGRREWAISRTNATSNDANILADDLHCDGGCKSGSAHTYPSRGGEAKAPDLDEQICRKYFSSSTKNKGQEMVRVRGNYPAEGEGKLPADKREITRAVRRNRYHNLRRSPLGSESHSSRQLSFRLIDSHLIGQSLNSSTSVGDSCERVKLQVRDGDAPGVTDSFRRRLRLRLGKDDDYSTDFSFRADVALASSSSRLFDFDTVYKQLAGGRNGARSHGLSNEEWQLLHDIERRLLPFGYSLRAHRHYVYHQQRAMLRNGTSVGGAGSSGRVPLTEGGLGSTDVESLHLRRSQVVRKEEGFGAPDGVSASSAAVTTTGTR
eukprot:gene1449-1662_t